MSAWGTLHAATLELAKGTPLKQRLAVAFSAHLTTLPGTELPHALRGEFAALLKAFESVTPMRGETAVQATVRKMSAEDADLIASRIVTLFGHVARASSPRAVEDAGRSSNESVEFNDEADEADVLPLFALKA
jgi:hypothetical protein